MAAIAAPKHVKPWEDLVVEFEDQKMSKPNVLEFLSHVVKTLDTHFDPTTSYGKLAHYLMQAGYLTRAGDLTPLAELFIEEGFDL